MRKKCLFDLDIVIFCIPLRYVMKIVALVRCLGLGHPRHNRLAENGFLYELFFVKLQHEFIS